MTKPLPHFPVAVYNKVRLQVDCHLNYLELVWRVRNCLSGDHGKHHHGGCAGQRPRTIPETVPRVPRLESIGSKKL